uniref:uncharacterized protein LOC118548705 n=1 Tax=Halichoerus grypus TaxID=9711 RepID=UPI001658FBDC|nr:uncharacterized protein LOC118548705 [Halichoerus grypus]
MAALQQITHRIDRVIQQVHFWVCIQKNRKQGPEEKRRGELTAELQESPLGVGYASKTDFTVNISSISENPLFVHQSFWPPELGGIHFCCFEPPSVWGFAVPALAEEYGQEAERGKIQTLGHLALCSSHENGSGEKSSVREAWESQWCNSCPSLKTQRTRSADVQEEKKTHTPAQTIRQSMLVLLVLGPLDLDQDFHHRPPGAQAFGYDAPAFLDPQPADTSRGTS